MFDAQGNVQHTTWRCCQLQKQWIVNHPVFKSIQKNKTITHYLSEYKLNKPDYYCLLDDISLLRPLSNPAMYNDEPRLADYVQLPCRLWVPEYFYPQLNGMPCSKSECNGTGSRQRWNAHGVRVTHGIYSAEYLYYCDYKCRLYEQTYNGVNEQSIAKLPVTVRLQFNYFLTDDEGATLDLLNLIRSARISGSSFDALYKQFIETRHDRMHSTIM